MHPRTLLLALGIAALLAPTAHGQGTTVVAADPDAQTVTALNRTIVWVSGRFGAQTLMQRSPDGTISKVQGAPTAKSYRTVDLGVDAGGELVLTYLRCLTVSTRCTAIRDDLDGGRRSLRGLTIPRCELTTAPAVWRGRAVYGLSCRKAGSRTADPSRSGLYFKNGARAPRRLGIPREARRAGADLVTHVDIRNSAIAAIAADISAYAFFRTATEDAVIRSWLVSSSEGDTDGSARGVAIGARNVTYSLATSSHPPDPNVAVLSRLTEGCLETQVLETPAGPNQDVDFRAVGVAADGRRLYLLVPGTGIVTHGFTADRPC